MHPQKYWRLSTAVVIIILLSFISPVSAAPYYAYDGTFINVPRLGWPVRIPENYTLPGDVATYNYTLEGGHTYHAYLIGDFVNLTTHRTDYDVFLYRETLMGAKFISSHTEAAGYPEQISNDDLGRYLTPSVSGNYYFTVRNDLLESNGSDAAMLMVVERLELNTWYSRYLTEPSDDGEIRYDSGWVYEFTSSDPRLKIDVDVPETLDMYEARLYIVGNAKKKVGLTVNGALNPWWPGLNGTTDGVYGGVNDDPQGFRHLNMSDSCETSGEDMLIDYRQPMKDELLYQLVLIPEYGNGTINVRVQTDFDPPKITLLDTVSEVNSGEEVPVRCRVEDRSPLASVSLLYTTDSRNWREAPYTSNGEYYNGTLPGQGPGSVIVYKWVVVDALGNEAYKSSQYKAMRSTSVVISLDKNKVLGGNYVLLSGKMSLPETKVQIYYKQGTATKFDVTTDEDGYFSHVFSPSKLGTWEVYAEYAGDESYRSCASSHESFVVERKPTSVTLNISIPVIGLGSSTNITGTFSEARVGYEVRIDARCGVNQTTMLALTDKDGHFITLFTPEIQGEWTLQAIVDADGIYTEGARSPFEKLYVGGPTIAKQIDTLKTTAMKPPYVYGLGAVLGGSIGGGLYLARKKGLIFKKKEAEPAPDEKAEDEDFDFEL
jgi:hypothetical protein